MQRKGLEPSSQGCIGQTFCVDTRNIETSLFLTRRLIECIFSVLCARQSRRYDIRAIFCSSVNKYLEPGKSRPYVRNENNKEELCVKVNKTMRIKSSD